jgi:hypothetical protein
VEYSGLQVRRINFQVIMVYNFERKFYNFMFPKRLLLNCNPTWPFLIILFICYFFFREKHGLVRNDFLDSMIELRKASKDDILGDVQSANNANTGSAFSKLQQIFMSGVTEYWDKLSEYC